MVKHTQTIRRQMADELFECVWPFFEIGAYKVKHKIHPPQSYQVNTRRQTALTMIPE